MKIKKGDTVKILAGKDRGKTGKVAAVIPKHNRAVVEGLNLFTRHQRPRKQGEKGQRVKVPMPLHVSNLMVVDPSGKKPTRVGYRMDEKGKKERFSKKSDKSI